MLDLLTRLLNAQLDLGFGAPILWREIIGNGFGLASAILGAQRKVWAWPIGIAGNVILFTVFLGGVFHTPQNLDLWGQAGRQVFFLITSLYGWVVWARYRNSHRDENVGVQPKWAGRNGRLTLLIGGVVMFVVFYFVLKALGSWGPAADAWILTGSILATYGMARGWTEFWLIWVGVDIVGVPLLLMAGYYPSAIMYAIYAAFVIWGFTKWVKIQKDEKAAAVDQPSDDQRTAEPAALS
ncbi:nicotinamide riboside transporter PnuC [Propionibacteriaceae bacterium G1746]|uniref:nicotinamide riboside transporter PnuC n=1 Tax=Aestuariimicrobium sp. G57 TaxID=3418485 RepID=UPI003C1AEE65